MLLAPDLVAQLGRHQLVPRRRVRGRFVGGHRSARLGASVEFADVREYVPGDDPRRIDLAASRRHGRLQVTLTEAEDDASAQVVVDRSASMHGAKRQVADRLAAALSVLGARDGVRLWLVEREPTSDGAGDGLGGGGGLGRGLGGGLGGGDRLGGGWARGSGALAQAGLLLGANVPAPDDLDVPADEPAGRPDLTVAVGRAVRASARGPLVLVSDLLFDGWDQTVRALGRGTRDVLVLQVLALDELRPHLVDDVRLVDAETGAEVEVGGDDHTAGAYAAALAAHLAAVEQACTSIGAAHLLVPTDVDLAQLLLAELPALGLVR